MSKRRTWRKLHIGVAPETGEIVAEELTGKDVHNADVVESMLEQVDVYVERFFG